MRKTITLTVEESLLKKVWEKAKENNSSLSRYIENILLREVK